MTVESRPPNDGWATASTSGALSPEEVATYRKQGFLAITDFASAEEMTNMRARAEKIVDEFEYDREAARLGRRGVARGGDRLKRKP